MSVKASLTNTTKCVQAFSTMGQILAMLDPGERLRVLVALVALFDPDVANELIRKWRGE